MKRIRIYSLMLPLLIIGIPSLGQAQTATPAKEGYRLLWADEFDVPGKPNPEIWTAETGGHGWGNNELQFYTDRIDNAEVKDGKLIITAKIEDCQNRHYTSSRLISHGKKDFTYGRIEVAAKLPGGKGTWPAIWMLGSNFITTPWPACGEIDIMEHVGFDMDNVHSSIHTQAYNHPAKTQKTDSTIIDGVDKQFHVYALNWTPTEIEFLIDDSPFYTYRPDEYTKEKWPFANPFFMILNLAIGGNWGGAVDETDFPKCMEVDYVRVYQPIDIQL